MVRSAVIVSLLVAASAAFARNAAPPTTSTAVQGAYIFELEDGHDYTEFYAKVNAEGTTRMKLNYKLFKGVSVQLNDLANAEEKASNIAKMPMVKNMWPVTLVSAPKPRIDWIANDKDEASHIVSRAADATAPDTFTPHIMTQVDKLRAKGITGKGIRVAVVDTGVDYTHPALGGCFGPKCLVSFGTDLVGNDYNGMNDPKPSPDPMDCAGHGTHVSGIIAAQPNKYGFTGAAPGVALGIYRVFGCVGSSGNDILIAAFNQAFEDGANIITASIGSSSGWSEDPWAVTISRIVQAGVPCTLAAGNDGDHGIFFGASGASGKGVMAVASVDSTDIPTVFSLSDFSVDGAAARQFGYVAGVPEKWDDVKMPLWAGNFDSTVVNDGCNPFPANTPDLSKYIVLIRRGTCTFVQKAQNAVAKGAKYIMIYNNMVGAFAITVNTVPNVVSAGMVENTVGESWIKDLKAGKKIVLSMTGTAKAVKKVQVAQNPETGGALSTFTSWGPTWEMDAKPQFSSVGGNVLSTYPLALGGYATLSGTSMATPLTAAIVALVAQVRRTFNPELITNALAANANPQLFNDGKTFSSYLASVAQQGAGLIQAYDAAYATTLLSQSSLSFNDTDHFVKVRNFTIHNTGHQHITYHLSHVPTDTVYALAEGAIDVTPFPNDVVGSHASIRLSEKVVSLRGGETVTIEVLPTPPVSVDAKRLGLWSGYIAINGTDGTSLSIPYQGLSGSLHKHTVLTTNDTWISNSNDTTNGRVADNATFILPPPGTSKVTDLLPSLTINLALGSPEIRVEIVPLTTCPPNTTTEVWGVKSIGQPMGTPLQYLARGAIPISWDGQLATGNFAPPGKYRFFVRALRIFGNANNKEDWDFGETTAFRIKYE